jgi:hypothetical protein
MKTAKRIKVLNDRQAVYELSKPLNGWDDVSYSHIVVSTAIVFGRIETYIFPSDAEGNILNWLELPGSQKNTDSHAKVLRDAGYKVTL